MDPYAAMRSRSTMNPEESEFQDSLDIVTVDVVIANASTLSCETLSHPACCLRRVLARKPKQPVAHIIGVDSWIDMSKACIQHGIATDSKKAFANCYSLPSRLLRGVSLLLCCAVKRQMQEQQLKARQLVLAQQASSAVAAASKTQREVSS